MLVCRGTLISGDWYWSPISGGLVAVIHRALVRVALDSLLWIWQEGTPRGDTSRSSTWSVWRWGSMARKIGDFWESYFESAALDSLSDEECNTSLSCVWWLFFKYNFSFLSSSRLFFSPLLFRWIDCCSCLRPFLLDGSSITDTCQIFFQLSYIALKSYDKFWMFAASDFTAAKSFCSGFTLPVHISTFVYFITF